MTKKQKLFLHIGVWYFLLFFDETINFDFSKWGLPFAYTFALVCAVLFYLNYFFLFPFFLKKGKYLQWVIGASLCMGFAVALRYGIEEVLFPATVGIRNYKNPVTPGYYITDGMHFLVYYLVISLLVCAIEEWLRNKEEKNELAIQSKNAELSFLKSQVNPHFLFNSLHNIYTLAYKKSDAAPDAILKLSGIMRYMLEESREDKVLLVREIEYLQDYISLQELRFKDGPWFALDVCGHIMEQRIAPLLLISFIENMFKHGEMNEQAYPAQAVIKVCEKQLVLTTANKIKMQHKDKGKGIGLQNVQRRLELMYTGHYDLKIEQHEGLYYSTLKLMLQ